MLNLYYAKEISKILISLLMKGVYSTNKESMNKLELSSMTL